MIWIYGWQSLYLLLPWTFHWLHKDFCRLMDHNKNPVLLKPRSRDMTLSIYILVNLSAHLVLALPVILAWIKASKGFLDTKRKALLTFQRRSAFLSVLIPQLIWKIRDQIVSSWRTSPFNSMKTFFCQREDVRAKSLPWIPEFKWWWHWFVIFYKD